MMIPRNCLRLACRTVTQQAWPVPIRCARPLLSRQQTQALSSAHDKNSKVSRFAEAVDETEDVSPFKRQRQNDLRKDQESEEPLYSESYPRLQSTDDKIPVPEFVEECKNELSTEPVTLTGRVRSKRVAGKSLMFLDIVNEFQKVQIMVNKKNCDTARHGKQKFKMFKSLIQVGDHICRRILYPPIMFIRCIAADSSCSRHWYFDAYRCGRVDT